MHRRLQENIRELFLLVERAWRLIKGARHSSYARYLVIAGVGLLSPTIFDFIILLLGRVDPRPCPTVGFNFGALGGVICLLGGIVVFIVGEFIQARIHRTASESEGRIAFSIASGWNFSDAAFHLTQMFRKPIELNGFSITECKAPLKSMQCEFGSIKEALLGLRTLSEIVRIRPYEAEENAGIIILTIRRN